jgi:hypothetical protein
MFAMGAPYGRLAGAMRRLLLALPATLLWLALVAPPALAGLSPPGGDTHPTGGQGTYGETDDKVVTNAAFILIAAFPLLVGLLSALQWKLDKRKTARKAAQKARSSRAEWAGGW